MKLPRFIVALSLSLASVTPLVTLLSRPVTAAEQTVLLCQGSVRSTARVYRSNGALMMRLYDRGASTIWFDGPARDDTNPESYVYVNQRGEGTYKVSAFRNGGKECTISSSGKPSERGMVQTSPISPPMGGGEQTVLLCEGNIRNTGRVYRSNGDLMMRLYDRQTNAIWFNGPARDATNPESYVYVNQRGEGTYRVNAFRNGGKECSIEISGKPLERGKVK